MKKLFAIVAVCLLAVSLFGAHKTATKDALMTSLAEATSTGVGDDYRIKEPSQYQTFYSFQNVTWTTSFSGTPTAITVILEGSLDGTNWFTMDTSTSTAGETRFVSGKFSEYLRCNISSYTVNGSTATCVFKAFQPSTIDAAYPGVTANTGNSTDVATLASSSSKKYATVGAPSNAAFTTDSDSDMGRLVSGSSYCYRVLAVTSCGQTTTASAETCITTTGGDDQDYVDVKWNAVSGAKAYYIYGRTSGAEQFLWQAPSSSTTWRDYGHITPSGAIPTTSPSACYGNIAGIKVVHSDGSTEMAVPTADTNAARGMALVGAVWSAGSGGSVYVPAGTYDIGAGIVDQSLGGTGGVNVYGAGPYQTIITTSVPHFMRATDANNLGTFPDCMVVPGSNSILDGVGIDGLTSSGADPMTAPSTCPWGTANFTMTYNITNAKVRNVHVTGISDGFYISNSSTTYGFTNLEVEHVSCDSIVDCMTITTAYPMTMSINGARLTSSGAHSNWGYATNVHLLLKGGTANLFDVVGLATSPQAGDRAYSILVSCGTVNVHASTLSATGTGTNYDLKQETDNTTYGACASSVLNVGLDTLYDSTKTNGTITTFSALPKATTGTRFVCVNTSGKIVVQASACSGT